MSVIETLKAKSLELRKARNEVAPAIIFALSEIDKVGKNKGNRQTTEDEAISVIKKLIATIDENLKVTEDKGRKIAFNYEKQILASVLPELASEDDVRSLLDEFFSDEAPKNKGVAMKLIRDEYGAKVDMKRAGEIVTELYGV